ncbi:MAG: hypothetical protein B6229_03835 [Spirochaetaceae bacterium 4572_7]|nr:MAG: hypothetical protein B6229_03835 [Spirochaetaceae bacterium 4572_7]
MKKTVITLLLLIITINRVYSDPFQTGNIEFIGKNYQEAEKNYLQDIKTNGESYNTLYNLGNLYIEDKQLGKAFYYLQLAKLIDSRDKNLNLLIESVEKELNITKGKVPMLLLSPRENQIVTLVLILLIASVIFTINLLKYLKIEDGFTKKIRQNLLLTLLILLLFSTVGNIYNWTRLAHDGIVLNREEVKISPYQDSESGFTVTEGSKIKWGESFNGFTYITLDKNNFGWIENKNLGKLWIK